MHSSHTILVPQLEHRQNAILHMCEGFPQGQALAPLYAGGPNANSILEHLLEMSQATLLALGGSAHPTAPGKAWPAPSEAFAQLAESMLEQAKSLTPDAWLRPPDIEVLPGFENSLSDKRKFLSGHIFHLAYHCGQLGSLRAKLA